MPSITYIVARSWPDNVIGCDNKMPWHLGTDLQRFRKLTLDHVIIMGRKTLLSIGRPLPNRTNIVLTRAAEHDRENSFWQRQSHTIRWAESPETALYFADVLSLAHGRSEFFVIGGSEIFNIYAHLFNRIYLTEVFAGPNLRGDTHWSYPVDHRKWRTVTEEEVPAGVKDDYPTRFKILDRRIKTVRYVDIDDYMTESQSTRRWIADQMNLIRNNERCSAPQTPSLQYHFEFEERAVIE